jgi:photosystem II stability/assembly factor-like uncharacterized protein
MKFSWRSFQPYPTSVIKKSFPARFLIKYASFSILVATLVINCLTPSSLLAQQKKQQKLYDDLFSVSFSTDKDGWACGRWGTILHTSDGGKTWVRQSSGVNYSLSSIFFVDSKHGWAVGDEGTIIHTQDGGKNWVKQKSPVSFVLMGVYFVNNMKGWIVTEQTHILYTDNGGKNWIKQFSSEDYILKAISFCDAVHGWAVGEYGYIYHTGNGGMTWEKQAGEFRISKETGEIVGGVYLFGVVAIDPKTVWAVGIDGYVTVTRDGGKTWQPVVTGARRTQLFSVTSDRKHKILIGGNGTFLSSIDNGKTWQNPEFDPSISYGWIYGVAPRGSSGFVAVGWKGAIYLNASTSWHRVVY